MPLGRDFVDRAVNDALGRSGCMDVPDLVSVARIQNVQSIRLCDQFSDGTLEPIPGGFRIYLKSPREYDLVMADPEPQLPVRTRFTLAHEIVHTFFYHYPFSSAGKIRKPKPLKGKPRPSKLEHLCQYGAGALLIPSWFLRERHPVGSRPVSASEMVSLSRYLRVSLEAIIRRLNDLEDFNPMDSAQLLVERRFDDIPRWSIVAIRCGDWFSAKLTRPKVYSDLSQWLRQSPEALEDVLNSAKHSLVIGPDHIDCTSYAVPGDQGRQVLECRVVL